ncbi:DUF5320 domain-containing protein [Candidatus Woesearchaeota archaeon]|jgi:hypothetical protein|nr:DUF5320 domain-containing protein [Candidatus Woesearchaeota archaeon]MBT7062824.1 DUF5320 domain-containing protein [Candidatus Woesearchaeota archaeon]MBT7402276.1 DUF5320 domain-containing protein [Candidatus Woesearchaeota archaeon]
MPNQDGTGRLGRGRNCDDVAISDRTGGGFGRGRGLGRGLGRGSARGAGYGFRKTDYQTPTKKDEKSYLTTELKAAEEAISEIKKRLQDLK